MKKQIRNDLILIGSLLLVSIAFLLVFLFGKQPLNPVAKIYVRDELVQTIDLATSDDCEFIIHGVNGDLKVVVKDHKIGVKEANCPHQDCVNTGFVSETNRPIICAYNQVSIIIEGSSDYDVVI